MTSRGITKETAERFQLGYSAGRLTIPYLTPAGPWHVKFRCIKDHDCREVGCPKYTYTPGTEVKRLFNAQTLLTADQVIVVEGEMDAIAAEQSGIAAVGYPGTANWAAWFGYCFDSAQEIVIVADGDDPGRESADRVAKAIRKAVQGDVRVVEMPAGQDTASFLKENDEYEFLELLGWLE